MNPVPTASAPRYKILYHHRTQDPDGQRVHIREIQHALRGQGHEVIEVSPVRAVEAAGAKLVPTLRRRLFGLAARLAPRGVYEILQWAYNVPGYLALARAIRRHRPDFIYERYALNTVAGVWASRRFRLPLLLEVNSPLAAEQRALGKVMFPRIARRLEAYVLRRASRVLAVTEVLSEMLVRSAGLDRGRLLVVQNGASPEVFEDTADLRRDVRQRLALGDDVVVGCVAFFHPWHGVDRLIACFARNPVLRRSARVLLVGDGPALPDLKAAAERLGIADRILFTGAVSHLDIPGYIAAIDVAVLPRAVEYASPLKLFEYMAAAKAIVAPRQRNLLEVVTEERDALCFAPEADGELEGSLERVVRDRVLRRRLGDAARATIARRELTWNANARRIVAAFESTRNAARLKVVSITSVFPSPWRPVHGLFVFERLRHLAELHDVRVIAPVPWMLRLRRRASSLPQSIIPAMHPPFFYIPGVAKFLDAVLLLLSALPAARRIRRTFDFDLVDAHFGYPDGLAGVLLGRCFDRPVVVTIRGTEIELCRDSWWRRRAIGWTLRRAARVIAVSQELAALARSLGVPPERIAVVPNGVDSARFMPIERRTARQHLGVRDDGPLIVTVGHLVPRKGFHRAIDALPHVVRTRPGARLVIVGGRVPVARSYEAQLKAQVARARLDDRVVFAGAVPPERVALWLAAADVFVLATDREGCPNAVWEALACGTPVVSTRAGEIERMVPAFGGILIDAPGDPGALADAVDRALGQAWNRAAIRRHAERHTWHSTANAVAALWRGAIDEGDAWVATPTDALPAESARCENVIVGR